MTFFLHLQILGMVATNWLLIADLHSIFHEDCIKLCQVHSDAVDYQKNGTPVEISTVPKPQSDSRPDWHAPETVDLDSSPNFYESQKAVGKLFRAINLPEVPRNSAARRKRQHIQDDAPDADLDEVFAALCIGDRHNDPLESAVEGRVEEFIELAPHSRSVTLVVDILGRYSLALQGICSCNALQRHKNAILSEEEAVIGTIAAKCSQRRKRKDAIGQLREHTGNLVKSVRDELSGDEESTHYDRLATAWAAWKVSRHFKDRFGALSYGWIALGEIFDAMKAIEQEEMNSSRR
jgi:RNA-dependent RNA polymerase